MTDSLALAIKAATDARLNHRILVHNGVLNAIDAAQAAHWGCGCGAKGPGGIMNAYEHLDAVAVEAALPFVREMVASELEAFAERVRVHSSSEEITSELTTCSNQHNASIIEVYRQAANIARVGADYKNTNCKNCRDTRGGPPEHLTEQCTWNPPAGMFDERESCIGQDLEQIGWVSQDGFWYSGKDNFVPAEGWRPVYVWKGWS